MKVYELEKDDRIEVHVGTYLGLATYREATFVVYYNFDGFVNELLSRKVRLEQS